MLAYVVALLVLAGCHGLSPCRGRRACEVEGQCSATSYRPGDASYLCRVASDEDCRLSQACTREGRCHYDPFIDPQRCIRADAPRPVKSFCESSKECAVLGNCGAKEGLCIPRGDADCQASTVCRTEGRCTDSTDWCNARSDDDCRRSRECERFGRCKVFKQLRGGVCVAPRERGEILLADQCNADCLHFDRCLRIPDNQCVADNPSVELDAGAPPAGAPGTPSLRGAAPDAGTPSARPGPSPRPLQARWQPIEGIAEPGTKYYLVVQSIPGPREYVRVRCADGTGLATDAVLLSDVPDGGSPNVPDAGAAAGLFMMSDRAHAPCQLEQVGSGALSCFDGRRTRPGACEPPLEPVAPPNAEPRIYGARVARNTRLWEGEAQVITAEARVVLGRSYAVQEVRGAWRGRCGTLESEEVQPLLAVVPPLAGEAWEVRAVLFNHDRRGRLPDRCDVRLVLQTRSGAFAPFKERQLGRWCVTAKGAKPGPCY